MSLQEAGSGTTGLSTTVVLTRPGEAADLAFSAIVGRHGPMVLQVCRSILRDAHDADDAFQATFLVLVRRAHSVRNRDSLASWLYGTALRVSACARADAARRRNRERTAAGLRTTIDDPVPPDLEMAQALHGELARLPERYRAAVVLCYLEGRTCEQAAEELGWPVGTVKSRLSRGRGRLQERLTRLGHQPSPWIVVPGLKPAELALITRTLAGGKSSTVGISPAVAKLVEGALKSMGISIAGKLAIAAGLVISAGLGLRGLSPKVIAQDPSPSAVVVAPQPATAAPNQAATFMAGTVTGPDGKPAGGVDLILTDGHLSQTIKRALVGRVRGLTTPIAEVVVRGRGRADEDGRFRLEVTGKSVGKDYRMILWAYRAGNKLAWSEISPESLTEGKPIAVRLEAGPRTAVKVLDTEEKPVAGVRVVSMQVEHGRISIPDPVRDLAARTTDEAGNATIDACDSDDIWTIRADSDRFGMQQWTNERIEAGPGQKVIHLVPAGSLQGRVVGGDGKPIAGTKLRIATLADGISGPFTGVVDVTTDGDGKFSIAAIPCGKLIVWFLPDKDQVIGHYLPGEGLRIEGGQANQIEIDRSQARLLNTP